MTTIIEPTTPTRYGGVDTHKDVHVAVICDHLGRSLQQASFETNSRGLSKCCEWFADHGNLNTIGIEGTGSWGKNLSITLTDHGFKVFEATRPSREHYHQHGKSDASDALAAARRAASGTLTVTPKDGTGLAETIRMIRNTRRSAVRSQTVCINQLRDQLATSPVEIKDQFDGLTRGKIIVKAAALRPGKDLSDPAVAARWCLRVLARRYQQLKAEITEANRVLESLVKQAAPPALLDEVGVGTEVAAAIVIAMGDNPGRYSTDSQLARTAGTAPVDASSGRQQRHRLNRGGNRDLNRALWRVVLVRLRWHQPTIDYVAKRMREGKTKKEAIRMVKRYLTRRVFRIYQAHLKQFPVMP